MSVLYITEYAELSTVASKGGQMPKEPPVAEQTVAISGTHAESSAFNAKTKFLRIETDAICSVKFGAAPVATTSSGRMAAGQTEYRDVSALPLGKVSVISNT